MKPWTGRRVFMTGHTGFKGSWLVLRLCELGATVTGYALPPESEPCAYTLLGIRKLVREQIGDILDAGALRDAVQAASPQTVVHLAAQPFVRRGYREPAHTLATNVLGTAHLLDAVRATPGVEAVLVVTSDKVYANQPRPLREDDRLGGDDPYSASKACTEIVAAAYRASFFPKGPAIATARAGNVIGGGDWGDDRLIPDLVRASCARRPAVLRYPQAVRPWQHVADVVEGYVTLLEALIEDPSLGRAWNFGPGRDELTVAELARRFLDRFDPSCALETGSAAYPENHHLELDAGSARERLGWSPRYDVGAAIDATADWYAAWRSGNDLVALTRAQLRYAAAQPAFS
jgi:CDP-glucose 4,6-dehydratase